MSEEEVYRKLEEMGGSEPGSLVHTQEEIRHIILINCPNNIYDYNIYLEFKDGILDEYRRYIDYIDF